MPVEAVLLDAGGVLLLPDVAAIARELADAGFEADASRLEPGRFARAHYRGMRAIDVDPSPGVDWPFYVAAYVEEIGITSDVEGARHAVARAFQKMEWTVVVESAVRALPLIAARSAHLALVSNSDGSVERLLRDSRIAQIGAGEGAEMVAIIDSHVVGVEKPDPRIFEMALEIVGVTADRAIHIGDSLRFDVVGARNAGIRPLHLDPYGDCPDDDHEHIVELSDVLQLL